MTKTIEQEIYCKKHNKRASKLSFQGSKVGAAGRIRTADLILTKDALYLLSYSSEMATKKGLEPSTSGVTGRRSNQLSYLAMILWSLFAAEAYHTTKNIAVSSNFLLLPFLAFLFHGVGSGRRIGLR